MLKLYVTLLLSLYVPTILCLSDEIKEMIASLHGTCVGESGVSEDVVARVNAEKVLPDDENLKCYIKCLLEQTGSLGDDGLVDIEATIALLPEDMKAVSEPIIRKCGAKVGANPCENAWLTHACYLAENPSIYELF